MGDERDFERPEGLYLSFSGQMMEPNTPVLIERVNGDCSVSRFIIARDEARKLIGQLQEFLGLTRLCKCGHSLELHDDQAVCRALVDGRKSCQCMQFGV